MARPAEGYRLQDGSRVPGVTTITAGLKRADALIAWAWQEGKEGRDFRATRDAAASAGTLAHALVEAHIRGRTYAIPEATDPDVQRHAMTAFAAFREWAEQTRLTATHTELSLVSETYRYGGTLDALLIGGKRAMGDWKSSGDIYPEMLVQVRAYGQLWVENFPDAPLEGGYHILRFDKTHGDFTHRWWGELDEAWEAFLYLRELYELEKVLRHRAK